MAVVGQPLRWRSGYSVGRAVVEPRWRASAGLVVGGRPVVEGLVEGGAVQLVITVGGGANVDGVARDGKAVA